MFDLEDELKKLPAKPGVYIMHDIRIRLFMWEKLWAWKTGCGSIFKAAGIIRPK